MDKLDEVEKAVMTLLKEGKKPTQRNVLGIIGGSFRDIGPLIDQVMNGMKEVEIRDAYGKAYAMFPKPDGVDWYEMAQVAPLEMLAAYLHREMERDEEHLEEMEDLRQQLQLARSNQVRVGGNFRTLELRPPIAVRFGNEVKTDKSLLTVWIGEGLDGLGGVEHRHINLPVLERLVRELLETETPDMVSSMILAPLRLLANQVMRPPRSEVPASDLVAVGNNAAFWPAHAWWDAHKEIALPLASWWPSMMDGRQPRSIPRDELVALVIPSLPSIEREAPDWFPLVQAWAKATSLI